MLSVSLATTDDSVRWATATVIESHYLHKAVDPRARPMTYIVHEDGLRLGVVMLGIPHATRCRGWWGYPGLPTQWQVVDLCRIWLDPSLQGGGSRCRFGVVPGFRDRRGVWHPMVATWVIGQVLGSVQRDRVALWPPVYPDQPYHIRLAISYHDPQYHRGTIYRQSHALPLYKNDRGAVPGPSGKFGWCWPLPEPAWEWPELDNLKPRNMRLDFSTLIDC